MPVVAGADFLARVQTAAASGTTPATYAVIADMNSFSRGRSRDVNTYPVFGRMTPHSMPGAREMTFSLSGFLNTNDPGQNRLRQAEAADVPVIVQVLFDGTNGFEQRVRVGSLDHGADPEGLQTHGFELTADGDPVQIGTGPIL